MPRVILVDLDGVLNEYKGDYDPEHIPPPKPDVKQFLKTLGKKYKLVIFTARPDEQVRKWLSKYSLDIYFTNITAEKQPAFAYIDDRCLTFNGSFEQILEEIDKFTPYWQDFEREKITTGSSNLSSGHH